MICLALLFSGAALAAEEAPQLTVLMLPTIQYAHQDIWTKTPSERGPAFHGVGQVVRQQPVHILVSATRFAIDPTQIAEVNYRVTFIRPDGAPGNKKEGLTLIPRSPGRDPRFVHEALEQLVFITNSDDPLGTWRVVVEATDVIGGVTAKAEQTITVCGDELLQEALPPGSDQGRWMMGYHHAPVPQQMFAAIKLMAETPPAGTSPRRDAENGAWLGFFEQVLADNPWLLSHIVDRLGKATGREREFLATLLAYAKRDELSFFQTLPEPAREAFMLRRRENWPVPTKEPLSGTQLDVLWGRFFASGRYEPIRDLVAVLAYHPYKEALENFKKLKTKPANAPVEVYKSLVFGAAVWSLRSNIQQDKVVRDYCEGILLRKELPEAEHGWLANAFQVAAEKLQKSQETNPPPIKPE